MLEELGEEGKVDIDAVSGFVRLQDYLGKVDIRVVFVHPSFIASIASGPSQSRVLAVLKCHKKRVSSC